MSEVPRFRDEGGLKNKRGIKKVLQELLYLHSKISGFKSLTHLVSIRIISKNEELRYKPFTRTRSRIDLCNQGSGSTIRIGREKKTEGDYAIYFKCQTSLVTSFRERYKSVFRYEGNRAILFNVDDVIPVRELSDCIKMALTYNLDKKRGRGQPVTRTKQ